MLHAYFGSNEVVREKRLLAFSRFWEVRGIGVKNKKRAKCKIGIPKKSPQIGQFGQKTISASWIPKTNQYQNVKILNSCDMALARVARQMPQLDPDITGASEALLPPLPMVLFCSN